MRVIEGHKLGESQDLLAEVVIVGSGAGGAVVAKILAEAGVDVIVLEEGPYVPDYVYERYRPTETLRKIGREAGTTAVLGLGDTPVITVMAGRAVGGSSIMTGGVCFRVPEHVHHQWVKERGLNELDLAAMAPAFESAEIESSVAEVPVSMQSVSTRRFVDGASKLGIPVKPMRRNTDGCIGHARCNFGCPVGAKKSVDKTYLPKAIDKGARVYASMRVDRITEAHGRATGVEGKILGTDLRFRVRAQKVVVAAGSIHSPLLLKKTGFRGRAVGRHLTLHPGFRVVARFKDEVFGWKGALQSAYVDAFEQQDITLTSLFLPPNVLAAGLPGVGKVFADRVHDLRYLGLFGGMVHDDDGGVVHPFIGREPLITYRLSARNKQSMIRGIQILAETYLAAGAIEVYPPFFGMAPIRHASEVKRVLHEGLSAKKMECVTFHPLGTCRIARDTSEGVVDAWGRAFELPGVILADGSVFPTSLGVNSQLPIMAMATRIGWRLRDDLRG
ncbi:MAG: GMC family oxidoreductase [Myxococcota bacterium]